MDILIGIIIGGLAVIFATLLAHFDNDEEVIAKIYCSYGHLDCHVVGSHLHSSLTYADVMNQKLTLDNHYLKQENEWLNKTIRQSWYNDAYPLYVGVDMGLPHGDYYSYRYQPIFEPGMESIAYWRAIRVSPKESDFNNLEKRVTNLEVENRLQKLMKVINEKETPITKKPKQK